MQSMKKEAKLQQLKELRKMMQKRMMKSFSADEGESLVSEMVKEKSKEEDEGDEGSLVSELREEMKEFFQKGNSIPSNSKTKVIISALVKPERGEPKLSKRAASEKKPGLTARYK